MKRVLSVLTVLSLGAFLFSCMREEVEFAPRKGVTFQATLTTDVQTRGIPYGSENKKDLDGPFTVWAYTYAEAGAPDSQKQLYGEPVQVAKSSSADIWIPTRNYLWPNKKEMIDFFAFAQDEKDEPATLDAGNPAAPTLTYTVPANVPDQHGLMVAGPVERKDNPSDGESNVALVFKHALAGVTFKTSQDVTIKEIKVSGIYDTGVFNMKAMAWESIDKVTDERIYTIENPTTAEDGVFNEEFTLMLLPQTCPEGATLIVTTDKKEVTFKIEGDEWKQGELTTYVLATDGKDYDLQVTPPTGLTFDGKDPITGDPAQPEPGVITSFWKDEDGNETPADWTVIGFYPTEEDAQNDTNRYPDGDMGFLTSFEPMDGNGETPVTVTYEPAVPYEKEHHDFRQEIDEELASQPEVGSESDPWNLANPENGGDFNMETANTYIVGAPGWYRIPMVAGNGVKNNVPNTSSYANNAYFDYKDQVIRTPYLQKTSSEAGAPASAFVVWEDSKLMDVVDETSWNISGVNGSCITTTGEGDDTVYWLNFHISKENIRQGLANIAVQDETGTVMWSWLIWVTNYKAANDKAVQTNPIYAKEYTLMSSNLGWVEIGSSSLTAWDEDKVYVRIAQMHEERGEVLQGEVRIMEIIRPYHEVNCVNIDGYSPYFQFGRKDPLHPGISARASGSLPTYGRMTTYQSSLDKVSVGTAIQHPGVHFSNCVNGENLNPFDWNTVPETLDYWWSGNTTENLVTTDAVVKTVYDPCQAGYNVPNAAAFTGFTKTGEVTVVGEDTYVQAFNEYGDTSSKAPKAKDFKNGWWFSVDGAAKTDYIFFPSSGYRSDESATLVDVNQTGYYWTAVPINDNLAYNLEFQANLIWPTGFTNGRRARALSVRPVREQ